MLWSCPPRGRTVTGTVGLTVEEARRRGQGSSHLDADPTYARRFLRRVSPYVSWAIVRFTPLSADAVTVASVVTGVGGGLLVGLGTVPGNILAVLLMQLACLLDLSDGEVARIRRTASRRGTYLDLIGHVFQNAALYGGAAFTLLTVTKAAPLAIAVTLLLMAFWMPFGLYARNHVVPPQAGGSHPDHGPRLSPQRPLAWRSVSALRYAYRRISFIWNYPASMNLFCVALIADTARLVSGATAPLVVPALLVVFGLSLAIKQIAHALSLVSRADWS